jgi:hypothetical protein
MTGLDVFGWLRWLGMMKVERVLTYGTIRVNDISGSQVRIGIEAPREMLALRDELTDD